MAAKTGRKKSASGRNRASAKRGTSGTKSRAAAGRGKSRSTSRAKSKSAKSTRKGGTVKKTAKRIGAKVLAGAVAGAMKAVIPPLEEAAGASERAAGINSRGRGSRASRSREA